jgi:hypothetical protein
MAERPPDPARLHELAELLRKTPHLGPEMQAELADLMDELSGTVDPATLPDAARKHVTESAAHLVDVLHRRADESRLSAARKRLEETAVRVEAEAPVVSGVLRRLIDALANLGV